MEQHLVKYKPQCNRTATDASVQISKVIVVINIKNNNRQLNYSEYI